MDDVIIRPKYSSRSMPGKRRQKRSDTGLPVGNLVIRQVLVSVILFAVLWGIHSIRTGASDYLSGEVEFALKSEINFKSVFMSVNGFISGLDIRKFFIKGFSTSDKDTIPAGDTGSAADMPTVADSTYYQGTSDSLTSRGSTSGVTASVEKSGTGNAEKGKSGTGTANIEYIKAKYLFVAPVPGSLSSPFGDRISPVNGTEGFHQGVDLRADMGDDIKASIGGTVLDSGYEKSYGNYLIVSSPEGITTLYAHCSKLLVKSGQKIKRYDVIARVGDTGDAVGPHLHFEIRLSGVPVNPLEFIRVPLE